MAPLLSSVLSSPSDTSVSSTMTEWLLGGTVTVIAVSIRGRDNNVRTWIETVTCS
ncbi:hypothetical protein BS17DRAFT_787180 [Gyrodon lividus]|nr:hypothetical protein BS17DRAFT_787180 [Gyrodon lividus]